MAEVKRQGLDADVIVADAHMGYFRAGSFEQRLREDVVAPARQRGYQSVWLAGISLGGFGAMRYARAYPGRGGRRRGAGAVCGDHRCVARSRRGGRPAALAPFVAGASRGTTSASCCSGCKATSIPVLGRPPLYIGYGDTDRLQPYDPLMVPLLPPDRLLSAPGGHDWAPWKQMWTDVLQRLPLPRLPGHQAVVQR